ncbi:MAG: polysaccharide deacetylase family protein [Bacteroidota bacterium]
MTLNSSTKFKSRLFIFTLMILSVCETEAQMEVQKWHNGRQAALSLTYDDGTKSHYTDLRPILNKYNLKGTFYLNTSLLSDHAIENAFSGSWEEFKIMADEGHEMGSHGVNHPDLTTLPTGDSLTENTIAYELWESKKVIEEKIAEGYHCLTHAYPFCTNNTVVREFVARYYESARTCGSMNNNASPNYLALNSGIYDWPAVRNSFFDDFKLLNSFFKTVESTIIRQGNWGILLSHEVIPFVEVKESGTWEPTSCEWMIEASKWLVNKANEGKLWIGTVADVTRYAKERDAFYYTLLSEMEDTITYYVSDSLDNSVFDFPLSVDIEVPSTWKMVQVVQKNNVQNDYATDDANPVIKAQVFPFEDTISLFKLPDNQLLVESAMLTEPGNEIVLKFNSPVILTDTTSTGIIVSLHHDDQAVITGFSYVDTDSLEVKINIAGSIYAGKLVNLNIEDSKIYSTSMSRLNNATTIPVINNSKLVEDEYAALSVSTYFIEQDDQSADIGFYVFSTSGFDLELESGWCFLSKTSGTEYDTIYVHFDNNLTDSDRFDTIAIYSEDGFAEEIILSQLAATPSMVQQEISGNKLSAYPSPGSDFIKLSIPEQCQLPAILSLVSMSGQKLETINIRDYQVSINIKGLPPGLYILQLDSEGSQLVERFIVQ